MNQLKSVYNIDMRDFEFLQPGRFIMSDEGPFHGGRREHINITFRNYGSGMGLSRHKLFHRNYFFEDFAGQTISIHDSHRASMVMFGGILQ